MKPHHCDLINKNLKKICQDFGPDVIEGICNYLVKKAIFTESMMKNNILCETKPIRKSSKLLEIVQTREDNEDKAFNALYGACLQFGRKETADILKPEESPHTISSSGVVLPHCKQELPATWPTKEHHDRIKNESTIVRMVAEDSQMYQTYKKHLESMDEFYPMFHEVRGRALIIINEKFRTLPERKGSEWDRIGLEKLFEGLGFRVDIKDNQTAEEIKTIIREEAEDKDHSDHDCFVFFILTHGKLGQVFGIHGQPVERKEIINTFRNVRDLEQKPKLLFFQACHDDTTPVSAQGSEDVQSASAQSSPYISKEGGEANDDENLMKSDSDPEITGGMGQQNNSHVQEMGGSRHAEEDEEEYYDKDIFEFKSTPDGEKSQRNFNYGSWFAQAVIYMFSQYAYKYEFYQLTQKVKALVSQGKSFDNETNVAELRHTPGRRLFFFPGLYKKN